MELRHLRYFVAVAEQENVSRAALKLHVSQPGLSRQIRDLEDEISFQLFERGAKSLKLTAAGKVFLTEARAVLQRAEEAVEKARAAAGGTHGEVHVGYAPSLTVQILPQALRAFQAEFTNVRVVLHDLSTEEMLSQLLAKKLQVALMVRPERKKLREIFFEELVRYPLCVAVSPAHVLARSRLVSLARVAREPLLGYAHADYPDYHAALTALFAAVKLKLRLVEEHEGINGLIAAVEAGRGIALVPACVSCMVGPRLKILPLNPAGPPIIVGAAHCKKNLSASGEKFIAAARPGSWS